jgi:hypothetical protein
LHHRAAPLAAWLAAGAPGDSPATCAITRDSLPVRNPER